MDYVGTIDGVAFEGGTAENADLVIGSHSFIDDFEDQLVGAKPGDVVEVNVVPDAGPTLHPNSQERTSNTSGCLNSGI